MAGILPGLILYTSILSVLAAGWLGLRGPVVPKQRLWGYRWASLAAVALFYVGYAVGWYRLWSGQPPNPLG